MLALKEQSGFATLKQRRKNRILTVNTSHKREFAQYLTPIEIAGFMAQQTVRYWKQSDKAVILDPGAGQGILSFCLIKELLNKNTAINISLDAWEMDNTIIPEMTNTYLSVKDSQFQYKIHHEDFITDASRDILWNLARKYDLVIMNPPYKKINSNTIYRNTLHDIGVETVNTYSAFMALSIKLLADDGILTAIVPRSFCNGLYFLSFRKLLLENTAILHIHSFETRDNAFADENVLQENIIITLKKTTSKPKRITVSHSKDKQFTDYIEKQVLYSEVISPSDTQSYISIPTNTVSVNENILSYTNGDLYFDVSTGPIVDFRLKEKLIFDDPSKGIPLLYSVHIRNHEVNWPVQSKKPNAIMLDENEMNKMAFPKGCYVLIKRFSSKEEKRRIYATLLTPDDLSSDYFTVENHINIIHNKRKGLSKDLAYGLTAWLNTRYCDNLFRNFSGHTQVNATDLRNMKYPSLEFLSEFGKLVRGKKLEEYDQIFEGLGRRIWQIK